MTQDITVTVFLSPGLVPMFLYSIYWPVPTAQGDFFCTFQCVVECLTVVSEYRLTDSLIEDNAVTY